MKKQTIPYIEISINGLLTRVFPSKFPFKILYIKRKQTFDGLSLCCFSLLHDLNMS